MSNDKPEQTRTLTNEQQNLRAALDKCGECRKEGGERVCAPCWRELEEAVELCAPPPPPDGPGYLLSPERPETSG